MNTIELLGHYGGDEAHALSAWTSTSRDLTEEKRARIPQLLSMLAKNGHHTPFEKSDLHFLIRCDDATHIHILKHRIGVSVNGESARYKELTPTFHIPEDWPERTQKALRDYVALGEHLYHCAILEVEPTLGRKRAKESARYFLPKCSQLTLDVSFNFRSFMHFVGLRGKPDAQKEVYDLTMQAIELVRDTGEFTHSMKAFGI